MSTLEVDAATLDSEGRCVILEFPAFVLLGTYCPANRDDTRDDFRLGFLNVLDARIRNLVAMGKRVIWAGDLNISREELDTAAAEESMRKNGMDGQEYVSTPSRRIFNQLLVGGKVFGERDEGRERPILWDICRGFHEHRKGMFTCWETKINARPGNYGARIDYVLCRADMKDWFCDSNIQEGLMVSFVARVWRKRFQLTAHQGSDHCPVYAILKEKINFNGRETYISDIVNPPGMFQEGKRKEEWSTKNLLPMSGKLIPEFDRRRNIRDMFSRQPSLSSQKSFAESEDTEVRYPSTSVLMAQLPPNGAEAFAQTSERVDPPNTPVPVANAAHSASSKRAQKLEAALPATKRIKSGSQPASANESSRGQQSLKSFFQAKSTTINESGGAKDDELTSELHLPSTSLAVIANGNRGGINGTAASKVDVVMQKEQADTPDDLILSSMIDETSADASRQTWGKLFSKPISPKCEHGEPCKIMLTKKPGVNCGRSFWMCARHLGPSGNKEKNTQWRCGTFIWASDWTGTATS